MTPPEGRRPTVAYLSFSTGEFDARSFRMARSAIAAGYAVTVYSRWHAGQAPVEEKEGYRLVRAPFSWRLIVPGLRGPARRKIAHEMAAAGRAYAKGDGSPQLRQSLAGAAPAGTGAVAAAPGAGAAGDAPARRRSLVERAARYPFRIARRTYRRVVRRLVAWRRILLIFPIRPLAWATALDDIAEPADIWHGMWAGSLPALERMRRRHGGHTIYDSRDVYMLSREFSRLGWPLRPLLAAIERHWAQRADRILTVNEPYADLLVKQLRVRRPPVVMNCPEAWTPPVPAPDRIRDALGIPPATRIALYQGQLTTERGIEQAMDAILEVDGAVLVLLGFGDLEARFRARASAPPYEGRVMVLPAVTPDELLPWTASADAMVMAIQPTTVNHRFTTPQKLFEAIATGVPVVASDLPGMAAIVNESGVGELCDPTSPASIAGAMRRILDQPAEAAAAQRARILGVAHERYNWDAQLSTLFALYGDLAPAPTIRVPVAVGASRVGP